MMSDTPTLLDAATDPDAADARAAAAGDRAAFARLAARHYERVHALAWRWTGSRAGAEDVAQETMIKVAQAIRRFRGEARVGTWICAVAYRCALDHLRAARKVIAFPGETLDALREAERAPEGPDAAEAAELWRAVRGLPDQQRDAVLLIYGEGFSHAEAAAAMGCSEATASWHAHEARKRLKILLTTGAA
jgi:RNA polymerase sigma-70 factor (ECF subfamily)